MKTIEELLDWRDGAIAEFGDASVPVGQLFARFSQTIAGLTGDVCCSFVGDEVILHLGGGAVLPLKVDPSGPRIVMEDDPPSPLASESLEAFGISEVIPGLWHLTPSLNIPGVIHVFVVLYDVPSPAPWERRIITT